MFQMASVGGRGVWEGRTRGSRAEWSLNASPVECRAGDENKRVVCPLWSQKVERGAVCQKDRTSLLANMGC